MGRIIATVDEYFRLPYMSNSGLSKIKKEFKPSYAKPSEEAFSFGKLFDCLLTQPDKADPTHEKYEIALKMVGTWRRSSLASVFDKFESQVAFVEHVGFGSGIEGKCLFDRHYKKKAADFKAVAAPTPAGWRQTIDTFDYDRQAAWYMEVGGVDEFWLIGFCKVKPWQQPFTTKIVRGDEIWKTGVQKIEVILDWRNKQLMG
jgi:hypothetical protein